MTTGNPKALKDKVEVLEQALLAIDTLSNFCKAARDTGQNPLDLDDVTFMLSHLIDQAMEQFEEVRDMTSNLTTRLKTA
jgi:CO dehydrogenase/acetyl-CoA synthase gamma subunit (corrinoid Fe-S protein)